MTVRLVFLEMKMQTKTSIRIGEFQFEPSTGELKRLGASNNGQLERLAPQPAQLLQLLIDRQPNVVNREEIQRALWPGVTSDFDRNLHFCVRQIRSALGESASAPEYIETIPRRGYRLIAEVGLENPSSDADQSADDSAVHDASPTNLDHHAVDPASNSMPATGRDESPNQIESNHGLKKFFPWFLVVAAILVTLASFLYVIDWASPDNPAGVSSAPKPNPRLRIAIMPFKTEQLGFEDLGNGEIALNLLEQLEPDFGSIDVMGPSTTEPFAESNHSMKQMCEEVDLDFVVNGRYTTSEQQNRLLVEVIRANDGRHVWVKYFDTTSSNSDIARLTSKALKKQIKASKTSTNDSRNE